MIKLACDPSSANYPFIRALMLNEGLLLICSANADAGLSTMAQELQRIISG